MKIVVCISNVPDTTTKIKFSDSKTFDTANVQWIINPWDELSLTRALEVKEKSGGAITKITVICVGKAETDATIRKALAIGADDAIRVNCAPEDSYQTAFQLAEAIKTDMPDVIFCGNDSSDFNSFAVGEMLAEFLNIQSFSGVSNFDIDGSNLLLKRDFENGIETIAPKAPFLINVQKGIAIVPRIPAMRGIMAAKTKPLKVVEPVPTESLTSVSTFELPQPKGNCKMVAADDIKKLVDMIHTETKVF